MRNRCNKYKLPLRPQALCIVLYNAALVACLDYTEGLMVTNTLQWLAAMQRHFRYASRERVNDEEKVGYVA
jgi:hypothetical protein